MINFLKKYKWALILFILPIIGVIIQIYLQNSATKPELKGLILGSITHFGEVDTIANPNYNLVFLYLANERNIPIQIVYYKLKIYYNSGYYRIFDPIFTHIDSFSVDVPGSSPQITLYGDLEKYNLLNVMDTLITESNPLYGAIVFQGIFSNRAIKKEEVIVYDSYGSQHIISTTKKEDQLPFDCFPSFFKGLEIEYTKQR